MLIGYVTDAQVVFEADLWSPGRDQKPTPFQKELLAAIKKLEIPVMQVAGGHGGFGPYAELERLAAERIR
jgi:hypothetical protein